METKQCKVCGAVMTRKPTTRDVIWKLTTMCSTACAIQANLRTGYQLKATGPNEERLYRRESYNHSTRATFSHFVVNAAMDAYVVPPTTGAGRSVGKGWKKI